MGKIIDVCRKISLDEFYEKCRSSESVNLNYVDSFLFYIDPESIYIKEVDRLSFVAFGTVIRKETKEEWTLELIGGKESRFFAHHAPLQEIETEKTSLSIPQEKVILPEIFMVEDVRIIPN